MVDARFVCDFSPKYRDHGMKLMPFRVSVMLLRLGPQQSVALHSS